MVRATTRTAPILMPEDVKQAYVYGLDTESIRKEFLTHLAFTLAELPEHVDSEWEPYVSLALTVRDRLIERWVRTQEAYYAQDAKADKKNKRPFGATPGAPLQRTWCRRGGAG